MYAHPGKKLVFMGTELGELDEWSCDSTVSWDLLSNEKHAKLNRFFKDINKFYLENKPLYELDTIWKGFDWIHHDDYVNSVIAFKRTDSEGNDIIAVCNFQPTKQEEYNIGVPKYGLYDEVFTSDRLEYGGTGVSNGTKIVPQIRKIHGCNQGLSLTLPPMGVIYLKCTSELDEVSD
jgi:1,4-alpha-glucan branching enzyme